MQEPTIQVCRDGDSLADVAAHLIYGTAKAAIEQNGRFTIALSGGSTPQKTYEHLTRIKEYDAPMWQRTWVFFGDERFVPRDHADSNYGMAKRSLLDHVALKPTLIFPVKTHLDSVEEAADDYALAVQSLVGAGDGGLDLVVMGLGEDGHTASLFPNAPALAANDAWATWSKHGTLPPPIDRVTLTFAAFNQSRLVVYLVAGEKKAQIVKKILRDKPSVEECPAVGVRPVNGNVLWVLDKEAASLL